MGYVRRVRHGIALTRYWVGLKHGLQEEFVCDKGCPYSVAVCLVFVFSEVVIIGQVILEAD